MAVLTRTPRVREMQRLQVELLLADHDHECATCIRHGDCELQDVAQFVGLRQNRFRDPARVAARPIDTSSPALIRDMTKCIRCQRCVAMCRDGQGVDALVVTGTGREHRRWAAAMGCRRRIPPASPAASACWSARPARSASATRPIGCIDYLYDPDIVTVVQFAPAIRVGFGEEFGLPPGTNVEGQIIAACRKLGFDIVLDTNFAADVVIMEEGTELLRPARRGAAADLHLVLPGLDQLRREALSGHPAAAVLDQVAAAMPRHDRQDLPAGARWASTPARIRVDLDHALHGQEGRGGAAAIRA